MFLTNVLLYTCTLYYYCGCRCGYRPAVGEVNWVPEQLNIKVVTGAYKLIDGCSLVLCSVTDSVVSAGICHRIKVNSIAYDSIERLSQKIVSYTLHYIHSTD